MSVAGQQSSIALAQAQEAAENVQKQGGSTVKRAGELIGSTITGASKLVGDTIGTIADATGLDQVSLAPGMSIEDFTDSLANAPAEGLGKSLENITGLNVRGLIGTPSVAKIKNLIKNQLGDVESLIALELQKCIENHILALLGKIPEIGIVLNLEQVINDAIAKERAKLQSKFTLNLDKLAFQKIKVQQIALFKQKIAEAVRNACPAASPRNITKYSADPRKIIEIAQKVAAKTTGEISDDAQKQAEGYSTVTSEKITETASVLEQAQFGAVKVQPGIHRGEVDKDGFLQAGDYKAGPIPGMGGPARTRPTGDHLLSQPAIISSDKPTNIVGPIKTTSGTDTNILGKTKKTTTREESVQAAAAAVTAAGGGGYQGTPRSATDPSRALRSAKNRVKNILNTKQLLYNEYAYGGEYIVVLDGDTFNDDKNRKHTVYRWKSYILTYRVPGPYDWWSSTNPGWKNLKKAEGGIGKTFTQKQTSIKPTQLVKVRGEKTSIRGDKTVGETLWVPGAEGDQPQSSGFAPVNTRHKSKKLLTYIEKHKTLDTERAQKSRLADILKRELAIDKELREAVSDLKGQGHNWPPQEILNDYFGGVPLGTSHLNEHFIGNNKYYLKPSKNLDSTMIDFNLAELATHYKGAADMNPLINNKIYKL